MQVKNLKDNNFYRAKASGFTLVELLIVVAIVGILAGVAFPSYKAFVQRGYISEALSNLTTASLSMEEAYQDSRTYQINNPAECAVADFNTQYFAFACTTSSRSTYLWTATSRAGALGASNFIYTVNQDSTKATTKYDGATSTYAGWKR